MTTFELAEKFFLCSGGGMASGGTLNHTSRQAFVHGAGSDHRRFPEVEAERSRRSPTEVGSDGEDRDRDRGAQERRAVCGVEWLRRHVRKKVDGGVYASHDSFLSRVRGGYFQGSAGGLAPLFEDHVLPTLRDTYSHGNYTGRLAASDATLHRSLRRYNSSLSLFPSGPSTGEGGYFNQAQVRAPPPPLRMATMATTRLFGSTPQLAGKRCVSKNDSDGGKLPDIKSTSIPQDINLNGSLSTSNSKLPSISDTNMTATSGGTEVRTERKRKRRRRLRHTGKVSGSETTGTASSGTLVTGTSASGSITIKVESDDEEYEEDNFLSEEDPYNQLAGTPTETTASAYIPPAESPDSLRLQAERDAEEEVKHNWLLEEDNKSRMKRFESRCNRLLIHVSDEDTVDAIENRLEELRMMSKPRKDERSVLDRLTAEQRERILRMNEIPVASLRKGRRKGWKPIHKLRWASSMIRLMARGVQTRRQYINEKSDVGQMRRRLDGVEQEAEADTNTHDKPSLGLDLLLALTMQPQLRTTKTVTRILWLLRATKAFKNLFPAEMELELAKVVGYERYDDGRVITKQGRAPDRFYYIISGKIGLYRQYQLSTGQVTKGMGFLTKGMTTDPEMMEKQICREDSLVARGQVEVLIIDKDAFSYLQHTTVGPPIEFIKALDLFEEFPVERFSHNHDAIEYTYYGTGKVIVNDSNRTPWLHIVKSGAVKVIRSQSVIDARTSNESKFITPRIEALGCGKPFSHANAMLGVQAKQKKLKSMAQIQLPQISHHEEPLVSNPFCTTLGVASGMPNSGKHPPTPCRKSTASCNSKRSKKSRKARDDDEDEDDEKYTDEEVEEEKGKEERASETATKENDTLPQVVETRSPPPAEAPSEEQQHEGEQDADGDNLMPPDGDTARNSAAQKRRRKEATLPIINIPTRDPNETFNPHPLWLTRERTDETGLFGPAPDRKRSKEQAHRQAYLQLGLLTPEDVFGLDHMQPALASEAQGVSLLSDGAEVIRISKRFFLQNAGNNTMLKVETMCNEYISEEDAQQVLFDKETWSQYKHALWERMTAGMEVSTQ